MNRGELWTVAGGVYASRPRPALVIQDDRFESTASVTVIPLTTTRLDAPLTRLLIPATETTGLDEDSYAMVDKVTTVRRANVRKRIGRVPAVLLVDVERSMMVFLGLAS